MNRTRIYIGLAFSVFVGGLTGCTQPQSSAPHLSASTPTESKKPATESTTKPKNELPSAPVVAISPTSVTAPETLTAVIVEDSIDPEGDTVTYSYEWYRNGKRESVATASVSASLQTIGETWTAVVTPNDGTDDGQTASDTRVVGLAHGRIALSGIDSCVLIDGSPLCWGGNTLTLDDSDLIAVNGYFATTETTSPRSIADSGDFSLIKSGAWHTCAVNSLQRLWCWGYDNHGSLGAGYAGQPTGPVEVDLNSVTDVALGMYHTCALVSGEVFCFGWNDLGALGQGSRDDDNHSAPVAVTAVTNVRSIKADAGTTCALTISNAIWCWGLSWGNSPSAVTVVNEAIESMDVSSSSLLLLTTSQKLYHVTISDGIQLAEELTDLDASKIRRAYFADTRYFAVDEGNALWQWERRLVSNGDGQPITYYTSKTPSKVLDSRVSEFAVGPLHQCALQGTDLLCWGVNSSGQVYLPPTTMPVLLPTAVTY